ncbi:MAG: hypothetical protein AAF945_12820, partial [Actinomycetota bacterium]
FLSSLIATVRLLLSAMIKCLFSSWQIKAIFSLEENQRGGNASQPPSGGLPHSGLRQHIRPNGRDELT